MIIDTIENLGKYVALNPLFADVVEFLKSHDLQSMEPGINRAAVGPAGEAAVGVSAEAERQRGMMIVVERAERLMPDHMQSKSLCDPLNGKVAELLNLILFHFVSNK